MLAAAKLLAASAAAYVLVRAGWIFGGVFVVAVVLAVVVGAYVAWRRGQRPVAGGVAAGAALSAVALML